MEKKNSPDDHIQGCGPPGVGTGEARASLGLDSRTDAAETGAVH